MLNILYDPEWVKKTTELMPTGICFWCQKSYREDELKDGFCAPCWTGIEETLKELGD